MNKLAECPRPRDRETPIESYSAFVRFLGKQPILDEKLVLYGQELLFRAGTANAFSGDPEFATRQVIDHYLLLIPEENQGFYFINCTREVLVSGLVTLLPVNNTILELLETIEPDLLLLETCRTLKAMGYRFALDDFSPQESKLPLLEFADFIKIDFRASTREERNEIYALARRRGSKLIAEKIETVSEMQMALSEGCRLFQGYFFSKPIVHEQRTIPKNQLTHVLLLAALSEEDYEPIEVERLTKSEASLCYRLLRLVNSARYATPAPVVSLGNALMMVGQVEMRKLVTVAMAGAFGQNHSTALSRMMLERARFCELLSPLLSERAAKLYLLGMLSLIDTLMHMPMSTILASISIDPDMKAALVGEKSTIGVALQLVRCYESGEWNGCDALLQKLHLSHRDLSALYIESIKWAANIVSSNEARSS